MRKLGLILAAAVLGVVAASVTADAEVVKGQFLVGPAVGVALPMGDFGDAAKIGFGGGATGDYMATENIAIGADLIYSLFGVEDAFKEPGVNIDITTFQGTAHAKFFLSPEQAMNPFFFGGAGIYNVKIKGSASAGGIEVSASASESKFGVNGGGGVMFRASESVGVSLQGAFHDVFTSGSSTTYISAGAAVVFKFGGPK